MRSVLVLILLMSACAPADAAPRRAHPHHPVVVRSAGDAPVPPGWYKFPGYPPIPPSENRNLDPSNFGGA
ncbi:hypothetical protein [Bradyrhizobium commune]|uniref:Uncharacterized protein n=1 Tax=Bradyrhizobium commune TaxID=83627 RepID=A0A7S9H3E7_9BRAD|nr:hypothetical protein [Bradyrhizobium commune]QPF94981.1 hypothetical protein IC761_17645 [Bradyrhizobium commune]